MDVTKILGVTPMADVYAWVSVVPGEISTESTVYVFASYTKLRYFGEPNPGNLLHGFIVSLLRTTPLGLTQRTLYGQPGLLGNQSLEVGHHAQLARAHLFVPTTGAHDATDQQG
jgi:hypothetical protein